MRKSIKLSDEHKKKISESLKGRVPKNQKTLYTPELNKKRSEKLKLLKSKPPTLLGINHPGWMGENAGYAAIHKYIVKLKGIPKYCVECKSSKKKVYDWANIDHKYSRNPDDYIRLCRSCHRKFDIKNNNYKLNYETNFSR